MLLSKLVRNMKQRKNKMINLKEAKIAFKKYVKKYNKQNEMIKLKIIHTYKVVNLSGYIAKDRTNKENL